MITHHIFGPLTVGRMLDFMNSGQYYACSEKTISTSPILVAHPNAHAIAEYYDVMTMKSVAVEKFKTAARRIQTENFIDVNEAVHRAPPSTDNTLRTELIVFAIEHLDVLVLDDGFNLALKEPKSAVHAFMTDISRAASRKIQCLSELHSKDAEVLDRLVEEAQSHQQESRLKTRVLESIVDLTNRTSCCHCCGKPSSGQLEKELELHRSCNGGDFYQIRCRRCHATYQRS
jgi:hypothetical protein